MIFGKDQVQIYHDFSPNENLYTILVKEAQRSSAKFTVL